jgi:hypothetical protein
MTAPVRHQTIVDTEHFHFLNPTPPFVDLCLRPAGVTAREFDRIAQLASSYPNDGRLVLMVKKAGDASAKVPYLMAAGETPACILAALREVAAPYVEELKALPEQLRSTIQLLLSINAVPHGCEAYMVTALLTLDTWQAEMTETLRALMSGRQLSEQFYQDNIAALAQLDRDWPHLRRERDSTWHNFQLPEHATMEYHPLFDESHRLVSMHETCIIVDPPGARLLQSLTPAVLQRPLPDAEPVPVTGSADWLIRDIGKIGRHFTRAMLSIVRAHLEEEKVALEASNYQAIHREAQDALREYVSREP